jgi:Uma2 family endonuclease
MVAPVKRHRYTYNDYVALERMSNVKHEFIDGDIYAMAGGSPEHAELQVRVSTALGTQLGDRCHVYSSDLRVRVLATGLGTYPDVSVLCGPVERDLEEKTAVVNPTVIVEVLSNSTEDLTEARSSTTTNRFHR